MLSQWPLLLYFLQVMASDLVKGQLPSSANRPYDLPPLRVIDEYKEQLEDDVYSVERKAHLLGKRECISGQESFVFCPLELNFLDFIPCIINPATAQGADAFTRGIKFPSGAFSSSPEVAVGISGIGSIASCDIKVEAEDVHAMGFNIVISAGYLLHPHTLKVLWIACPTKNPMNATVREFIPKKYAPAPPYFPVFKSPGASTQESQSSAATKDRAQGSEYKVDGFSYDAKQGLYDKDSTGYEETSVPVDAGSRDPDNPSSPGAEPDASTARPNPETTTGYDETSTDKETTES